MRSTAFCRLTAALVLFLAASSLAADHSVFRNAPSGVAAGNCNFDVVNFSCATTIGRGTSGVCQIIYKNVGASCSGDLVSVLGIGSGGTVDQPQDLAQLGLRCTAGSDIPIPLGDQSGINSLEGAAVCQGKVSLQPSQQIGFSARINPSPTAPSQIFIVGALIMQEQSGFTTDLVAVATVSLAGCTPVVSVPGLVRSGVPYTVSWTATADQTTYEIQEATKADFTDAVTQTTNATSMQFQHNVNATTTYYYRVRATNCHQTVGPYSTAVQINVTAPQPPTSRQFDLVVPFGSTNTVTQQVTVTGLVPNARFTATSEQQYFTITPSSGTTAADGSVTFTVTGDPTNLPVGANTGSIKVTVAASGKTAAPNDGSTSSTVPVSISLATPVVSNPKTSPSSQALVIPAVAHLVGGGGIPFQSDVRITNNGSVLASYLLTFTPANTDGTTTGRQTTITVGASQTAALNDILKDFFGFGATGDAASGVLEIRPLTGTPNSTFASSRTYATTSTGTFGQFVPAVPFAQFVTHGTTTAASTLTLTQVAQSAAFRTNLGILEGTGQPASGRIRVLDALNSLLGEFPFSLRPFEFQQLGSFLAANGLASTNARIEVVVDSATGGLYSYASVLDNTTTDPLLVSPATTNTISATRYVLPGMADLNNGAANFHSDIRVFNAAATGVDVTFTYYPQGNPGSPVAKTVHINPFTIFASDNVLPTLLNVTSSGGAIVVTTAANSSLVVSGRTYSNAATGGTYGQFIPAISPTDGIGGGDPALQVLQLEQSKNFRSNIGMSELTGNPVTVQLTVFAPGSKVSASTNISLAPNEFTQLNGVIASLFPGVDTYNARAVLKVIGGTGRVTAYASVVDNFTQDPTYVPAQK